MTKYLGKDDTVCYYSNYGGGSRTKEAKTQRCYGKMYTDFYKSHNCTEKCILIFTYKPHTLYKSQFCCRVQQNFIFKVKFPRTVN